MFEQLLGRHGSAKGGEGIRDRARAVNTEQLQLLDKLAARASAAAALSHLAREVAEARLLPRIAAGSGRNEQREGNRLEPFHRFGQERQPVIKLV